MLWTWFSQIPMNTVTRSNIVVNLMDQTGKPAISWTLNHAFPTKLSGTDLKSDGSEVCRGKPGDYVRKLRHLAAISLPPQLKSSAVARP
jgi:hypothetical protein